MRIHLQEVHQLPDSLRNRDLDEYDDWGVESSSLTPPQRIRRWLVLDESEVVGEMSGHEVPYGPTKGSISMNIGISVLPEFRRRGIGSQAQRILAHTLHAEGYVRVEASTDITNIAEQKALDNAGFHFEGVLRAAQVRKSGRHDLQLWSHIDPRRLTQ